MVAFTEERVIEKNNRNSNIEMLRYLSIIFVVVAHFNHPEGGGGFAFVSPDSSTYCLLNVIQGLAIPAVNVFVLITGFYGIRSNTRSIFKPIILLLAVVGYKALFYIGGLIAGVYTLSTQSLYDQLILQYYFVMLYCTLYVLSPYLNIMVQKLTQKQFFKMLILIVLLFSVYPTLTNTVLSISDIGFINGISTISATGDGAGYTIITFVMMYLIGAYISMYCKPNRSFAYYFGIYMILPQTP